MGSLNTAQRYTDQVPKGFFPVTTGRVHQAAELIEKVESNDLKVFYNGDCDLRNGIDGLLSVIENDGLAGQKDSIYIFLNKNRNRCKVLYYDGESYCLWYKRILFGTFDENQVSRGVIGKSTVKALLSV